MAKNYMTPGVYIEEVNAFPGSVVEVATAIPAFIGYTEKASRNGRSLSNVPTRVTSLKEYVELFGKGNNPSFDIKSAEDVAPTITIGKKGYIISHKPENKLFFYDSIRLFYANGGSSCYIVSVGTFGEKSEVPINKDELQAGLDTLVKEQEPTMIVIPDAVNLDSQPCYDLYGKVLQQCAEMQSRVAIVDIHEGYKYRKDNDPDLVDNFREKIGSEYLNYAAAYYPWLDTSVVQKGEITFKNLASLKELKMLLPELEAKNLIDQFPESDGALRNRLIADEETRTKLDAALKKDKAIEDFDALRTNGYKLVEEIKSKLKELEGNDWPKSKEAVNEFLRKDAHFENMFIAENLTELKAIDPKPDGYPDTSGEDGEVKDLLVSYLMKTSNLSDEILKLLWAFVKKDEVIEAILKKIRTQIESALVEDKVIVKEDYEKFSQDEAKFNNAKLSALSNNEKMAEWTDTNAIWDSYKKKASSFSKMLIADKKNELDEALKKDAPIKYKQADSEGTLNELYVNSLNSIEGDELIETSNLLKSFENNKNRNLHLGLVATSTTYSNILEKTMEVRNSLPPSSAMAGIYTAVDNSRGVWKAPANVSISNVIKPSVNITHDEQENLNVDAISGKSINAIRTFPGIGTLVWGGRTLDGNSLDWRYINVRRTIIMLEQSIKLALRAYVFEPNDANTWVTVKSMIVNFLTDKWKQGALAGASPEDAFDVQIGLGSTMTGVDILEGRMLVSIKLAIVRPAEFIVVTFQQQMQKS